MIADQTEGEETTVSTIIKSTAQSMPNIYSDQSFLDIIDIDQFVRLALV